MSMQGLHGAPWCPKQVRKYFRSSVRLQTKLFPAPGDVTWSSGAGQGTVPSFSSANITLPANKTFLITGYLAIAGTSSALWATFQIQDASNSISGFVFSTRGYIESSTEGQPDSPGGPAIAMLNSGSSSKEIKLRVLAKHSGGNLVTTSNSDPYAETILLVQEL